MLCVELDKERTDPWLEGRAEIVVIGGGPAGYPAAFDAADRGMDVTLVNDEAIPGGVCLHRGCIPSKALLHVADLIHEAEDAIPMGRHLRETKARSRSTAGRSNRRWSAS